MTVSLSMPPAIRTLPFGNKVAECAARAVPILFVTLIEPAAPVGLWASPMLQAISPVKQFGDETELYGSCH